MAWDYAKQKLKVASRSASFGDEPLSAASNFVCRRQRSATDPKTSSQLVTPSQPYFPPSRSSEDYGDGEFAVYPTPSALGTPTASHSPSCRSTPKGSFLSLKEAIRNKLPGTGKGERRKSKKEKKKDRPKRANQLEKNETFKLNHFWRVTEPGDTYSSLPTIAEHHPPPPSSARHSGQKLPGLIFAHPKQVAQPTARLQQEETSNSLLNTYRTLAIMDHTRLAPATFDGPNRHMQIQDARDMYQTVLRNAERSNTEVPPYDFIELIGKGGYGRVYKCRKRATGELVAVKIINIDDSDFKEHVLDKDNTIASFQKEVAILQQLKDSKAKNINMIHDAFDMHNQLWIISDYCTGGSLRTLMRANPRKGFEEHFIIPIARELAIAIKSVHDIGVIHRDIKCANVYVNEEGDIQLGDFGIVGVLDDGTSKRRTIVGTPHYLPLEMHTSATHLTDEAYGTELDIWSYGITVFEMATGLPPYTNVPPERLAEVTAKAPRLEGGDYSDGLKDFVAFCLNSDPKARPSADQVLHHPYIADTAERYPTRSLVKLIERYAIWEYGGGQRQSLFFAGGAAAPVVADGTEEEQLEVEDWNFSTSDSFNADFNKRMSMAVSVHNTPSTSGESQFESDGAPFLTQEPSRLEQMEQHFREMSANRGERSLDRLFNPETTAPYELHGPVEDPAPLSDLPLRNIAGAAPTRESLIDLDSAASMNFTAPTFNFDFGDLPTLKARTSRPISHDTEDEDSYQYGASNGQDDRRATMEWKFPATQEPKRATMEWTFPKSEPAGSDAVDIAMNLPPVGAEGLQPGFRPTLMHTATEPLGQFGDFIHPKRPSMPRASSPIRESVIDLDLGLADPGEIPRPATASSTTGSTMTDMTSGNPFDLESDTEQNERDRNRFSYHKQWQSEGGPMKRLSHKTMPMHSRGSSLTSSDSDFDRVSGGEAQPAGAEDVFDYNYGQDVANGMRSQLAMHIPSRETEMINHWPDFPSDSGLDEIPQYPATHVPRLGSRDYPLAQGLRTNGMSGHAHQQQSHFFNRGDPRRELEFPQPLAPHPDALMEDADPNVVVGEMDRLLGDLDLGIRATSRALKAHSGETPGDISSETDGGYDSGTMPTADEDEGGGGQQY